MVAPSMTAGPPVLETRGLTKRFGGLVAVDQLSITVPRAQIRGLIGPNGSGKTTTVNVLSGLYRPDGGEIHLCGRRTDKLRPHEITACGIARTFQIPKLFGHMTVLENVLLPALAALDRGAGGALPEITERARRLLDFVTLDRLRHAPAKELSGGQSMLIQIARALMVRPLHLVLMDEPFAGVHPSIRDIILDAILKMNREEEITFLIVSHEMAELRRLLDFVTLDRLRHAPAKELSGGQSMLIQIARALMVRPLHLVLMDEPFAGVHPSIRDIILEAILKMNREEEITFLIVSHEMAELRRLCQRVSVMDEGRLIAEGTLEEVANNPLVLEAYLGP